MMLGENVGRNSCFELNASDICPCPDEPVSRAAAAADADDEADETGGRLGE